MEYRRQSFSTDEMMKRSHDFLLDMDQRRSVRDFSEKVVPPEIINNIIMTASTAPSGANRQPWTFCVVADREIKRMICVEAEKEEYNNYHGRMNEEWMEAIRPLQTSWSKPFLESAPYIIVVFRKIYDLSITGEKKNNYYVMESVGLACGLLIAAIHHAGLASLVHTPSPMNFLSKILNRPENEKPFLLIPVGYPSEETYVPDLKRKSLHEVATFYNGV